MRKLLLVALVGCWSSSPKPASEPAPPERRASASTGSTGGATYGGDAYGGETDVILSSSHGGGSTPAGGAGAGNPAGGGSASPPAVTVGGPSGPSGDALDKAIIRRYIRRSQAQIQQCYEQELLSNPSLAGVATIRFTIGGDGKVVRSTGYGLPPVDACVAGVVAAIQFPQPKGGGFVAVSYPFIFRQSPSSPPSPPSPPSP